MDKSSSTMISLPTTCRGEVDRRAASTSSRGVESSGATGQSSRPPCAWFGSRSRSCTPTGSSILSGEHWPVADLRPGRTRRWRRASMRSSRRIHCRNGCASAERTKARNMYLSRCIHRWVSVRQPRSSTRPSCRRRHLQAQPLHRADHHRGVLPPPRVVVLRPPSGTGSPAELGLLQGLPVDRVQPSVRRDHPAHRPGCYRLVPPRSYSRRNLFPHSPAPRRRTSPSPADVVTYVPIGPTPPVPTVDGPQVRAPAGSMEFGRGLRTQGRHGRPA